MPDKIRRPLNGQRGPTFGEPLVLAVKHQVKWKESRVGRMGAGKTTL